MFCTIFKNLCQCEVMTKHYCIIKFGVEDPDTYDTWVKVQELLNVMY